jgi:hypothetical protein
LARAAPAALARTSALAARDRKLRRFMAMRLRHCG